MEPAKSADDAAKNDTPENSARKSTVSDSRLSATLLLLVLMCAVAAVSFMPLPTVSAAAILRQRAALLPNHQ